MRYAPDQSEKTRDQVVKIAAAQMRKHGPDKVSVGAVMSGAGLTHGGFYAHFKSKDDLIAAAIDEMFVDARAMMSRTTEGKTGADALHAYFRAYVSRHHRDHPESGCAVAALASDIHRQGRKARAAYDRGIAGMVDRVAGFLANGTEAARRALAISLIAQLTGAVAAARAVSDVTLSDEILLAARRDLCARAGLPPLEHER